MNSVTDPNIATLTGDRERFADYVYTPLKEAVETLRIRQAHQLFARDKTIAGAPVPWTLRRANPVGVLFRQIGSPSYETRRVVRLAQQHGLSLIIWEFHADRFLTRNRCKIALGRLGFYAGLGRNGGRRIQYVPVFDLDAENGRPLRNINTFRGEPLIDFHHKLLAAECPEVAADALFDASDWFATQGGSARHYYAAFTSLFLRHAILFETFVLHGSECDFTREVFLPGFQALYQQTGVKPLIVPSEREDWEGDDFWQLYPEVLQTHLGPYRVHDRIADETGAHWITPSERELGPVGSRASRQRAAAPAATGAARLPHQQGTPGTKGAGGAAEGGERDALVVVDQAQARQPQ